MSQHLPDHLDPWRFADLGKRISGSYQLKDLPRLSLCLIDSQGEVSFTLEFFRDRQRRACLRGRVVSELLLQCQRCLDVMRLSVDSEVALAFVESIDEAEGLPDELDPQLVDEGRVSLRDLIEDELLLALPQVSMHPDEACKIRPDSGPGEEKPAAVRENPIAVLAELKRNDK